MWRMATLTNAVPKYDQHNVRYVNLFFSMALVTVPPDAQLLARPTVCVCVLIVHLNKPVVPKQLVHCRTACAAFSIVQAVEALQDR